MGFMKPDIQFGEWYRIETDNGTWFVPKDVVGDPPKGYEGAFLKELLQYTEGSKVNEWELFTGWGARLSAPGYMDCTDWTVFETEEEAKEHIEEFYEVNEDGDPLEEE